MTVSPTARGRTTRGRTTRGRTRLLGVPLAALSLAGCASGPDRAEVLTVVADDGARPAFDEFDGASDALVDAVDAVCAPDAGLAAGAPSELLVAIETTRRVWYRSEAFWFGPVMDERSWARIDWPIATDEIDELLLAIDAGEPIDAEWMGSRVGADQRGLEGLAYVTALDDAAPVPGSARCTYLRATSAVIATEADSIADAWRDTPTELADDPEGAIDTLVADSTFALADVANMQLGDDMPLGDDGTTPLGVGDSVDRVTGVRSLYRHLGPLLSDDLAVRLDERLGVALTALEAAVDTTGAGAADWDDRRQAASDAVEAAHLLISTEVVAELGVTIGFSDADGDSG